MFNSSSGLHEHTRGGGGKKVQSCSYSELPLQLQFVLLPVHLLMFQLE